MSKYWYAFTHYVCPVCCSETVVKERVGTIDEAGHDFRDDYCGCEL